MENENKASNGKYHFLEEEYCQKYFADLNIELLKGRHIQSFDFYLFNLVERFYEEFSVFYKDMYNLILKRDKKDNQLYFYLAFPDDTKGKLYHQDRHKELSDQQTIIGIILLSMYYEKYFIERKQVTWDNIKEEILQSEFRDLYQRALFGEVRAEYTEREWDDTQYKNGVKNKFEKTIKTFNDLGWVSWIDKEAFIFELNPSINRLAELYSVELTNLDEFSKRVANVGDH